MEEFGVTVNSKVVLQTRQDRNKTLNGEASNIIFGSEKLHFQAENLGRICIGWIKVDPRRQYCTVQSQYIISIMISYMSRKINCNKYQHEHGGRRFPEIFISRYVH
jgi:hypothetical protein